MPIRIKKLEDILYKYRLQGKIELELPAYAHEIMMRLRGIELAADFVVCNDVDLKEYNAFLHSESIEIKDKWTIFATSGQGDFWLLEKHQNNMGFYDHEAENIYLTSIQSLDFNLEKWVVLANLVYQLEEETDEVSEQEENDFREELIKLEIAIENLPFAFL
ncbi:hypothetical protein [Flavobacterium sp. '19STA2R22 D10 B1']|uniref:hypothetical protein n=1 Tax=Flavobacterium aerium TaxID=3037261 RepID=UPI00278C214E|nr:hypothetical protein [Flavobacterium sp. '19STA2R22 D10 B1']